MLITAVSSLTYRALNSGSNQPHRVEALLLTSVARFLLIVAPTTETTVYLSNCLPYSLGKEEYGNQRSYIVLYLCIHINV